MAGMDPSETDAVAKVFCLVIAWCVIFGWVGSYVARQCGRKAVEGLVFGFALGPLGVIIVALLPHKPH
jgi:hypothetical protein